jgi:hypothetical protein
MVCSGATTVRRCLTEINASSAGSSDKAAFILAQKERAMTNKSLIIMIIFLGLAVAVGVGTKAHSTSTYYQSGWTCPSC